MEAAVDRASACWALAFDRVVTPRGVGAGSGCCDRIRVTSSSLSVSVSGGRGLALALRSLRSLGRGLGVLSPSGVNVPVSYWSGLNPVAINSSRSVRRLVAWFHACLAKSDRSSEI
jgi:hypothetical protein